VEYCQLGIDSYALKTKYLYLKFDPLLWIPEEVKPVDELKQVLPQPPVLTLPSLEQPFHLLVNINKGVALGWPSYLDS
jgi:hypothetical protein